MKKAFKCLMSSILILAMVVTTGISSKAAEFKDGAVSQASVQASEAELCGSNAKGGITTHSWKRWIATNTTWHFYSIYAVYEIPDKLKNAEWTVSNKQIAKVVKTKNGMAIRTGKKTGTVVVQTKYRSESGTVVYKIKIQVVSALFVGSVIQHITNHHIVRIKLNKLCFHRFSLVCRKCFHNLNLYLIYNRSDGCNPYKCEICLCPGSHSSYSSIHSMILPSLPWIIRF